MHRPCWCFSVFGPPFSALFSKESFCLSKLVFNRLSSPFEFDACSCVWRRKPSQRIPSKFYPPSFWTPLKATFAALLAKLFTLGLDRLSQFCASRLQKYRSAIFWNPPPRTWWSFAPWFWASKRRWGMSSPCRPVSDLFQTQSERHELVRRSVPDFFGAWLCLQYIFCRPSSRGRSRATLMNAAKLSTFRWR